MPFSEPDTIKVQTKYGNLPLHIALYMNASSDVIILLLQAYPKATEIPNNNGMLPLHYALWFHASSDIVTMLL